MLPVVAGHFARSINPSVKVILDILPFAILALAPSLTHYVCTRGRAVMNW